MAENPNESLGDEFYKFLREKSNDGRIMEVDCLVDISVPGTQLTEIEEEGRTDWNAALNAIKVHYATAEFPLVDTTTVLLNQRLVAPNMGFTNLTARSTSAESRKGRRYPPPEAVSFWNEFDKEMREYVPEERALNPREYDFFLIMNEANQTTVNSEATEQAYLLQALTKTLKTSGILGQILQGAAGFGMIDFSLMKRDVKEKAAVIGECKSTHNLLLPSDGEVIVEKYKEAFRKVITNRERRTPAWSHMCHPLGHLLGCMVDNECQFGALTTATRTYFVHVSGSNSQVRVSNAYFIGEADYLRAWAFVYDKGNNTDQNEFSGLESWLKTSKDSQTRPRSIDGQDTTEGTGGKKRRTSSGLNTGHHTSITSSDMTVLHNLAIYLPVVPFSDIEILGSLGYGRNGTVFKALWDGKEVALKQFDVGREGDQWFEKEIAAYVRLKDAWGVLVPRPLFLSESPSGGVMLLGLQLGRPPTQTEDIGSELQAVLDALRSLYGVIHNDPEERNAIFVADVEGHENLVVLDWEDWEDVR